MMKKVSIIFVLILALFVVNVSAGPLNSFAENPIPYWDVLSNTVSVSWDSTEQTVTVSAASDYWEDCSDVSEWLTAPGSPPISDGNIMSLHVDGDGFWDWFYDNTPDSILTPDHYLTFRYRVNHTNSGTTLRAYIGEDEAWGIEHFMGTFVPTLVWQIYEGSLDDWSFDRFTFRVHNPTDDVEVQIDYIRISDEIGELNIGVPLILQDSQEIELYVNSTFLYSEVRLEIYADTEALDTYCVFNSSYVVFPNNDYAQTDGPFRIEFILDNARTTGIITVFAENGSLINQYETTILSGTTFLRMTDSVFHGSIILYYLNGDTPYSAEFSIIEELFLSTGMIGYIGPLLLVVVGWWLVKKAKGLGVIAFIVESLFVAQYLELVGATPDYWWQIFILIFGMLFTVVLPLWDR